MSLHGLIEGCFFDLLRSVQIGQISVLAPLCWLDAANKSLFLGVLAVCEDSTICAIADAVDTGRLV